MESAAWNKDIKFYLTANGVTNELHEEPLGWNKKFVKIECSEEFFGIFRTWTADLTFVKDGAYWLRSLFYAAAGRTFATCTMQVKKYDRQTMVWDILFTGAIDFNTFSDTVDGVRVMAVDNGIAKWIKTNKDTEYNIALEHQFKFTVAHGLSDYEPYYQLMLTLLDRVTEGRMTSLEFACNLSPLNDLDDYAGLTNGKALRDPMGGTNTVKITFTDLMGDLKKRYCLGCYNKIVGDKNTLFIAPLEDIFDVATELYDIGEVSGFQLSINDRDLFKKVDVGYENQSYEGPYKTLETHFESTFVNGRKNTTSLLDLKCKYRADAAGILWVLNDLTDEEFDDQIWHINLKDITGTKVLQTGYLRKGTGPTEYQIYNYGNSPALMLIAWSKFINSCMDGSVDTAYSELWMEAWGGDNNVNQTSPDVTPRVWTAENYNYAVGTDKLFLPYVITVKAPCDYQFFQSIASNGTGYISFTYRNQQYKGFLMSGELTIAEPMEMEFTLLSHPDNDFSKLIRR